METNNPRPHRKEELRITEIRLSEVRSSRHAVVTMNTGDTVVIRGCYGGFVQAGGTPEELQATLLVARHFARWLNGGKRPSGKRMPVPPVYAESDESGTGARPLTFECAVAPDGAMAIYEDGSPMDEGPRADEVRRLVGEVMALPEPWSVAERLFESRLAEVEVSRKEDGVAVVLVYRHDDGKQHPLSKRDRPSGGYSSDCVQNGVCYHCYPSVGGVCSYVHEGFSSLDELHKDNPLYSVFRRRYDRIVEFCHEYLFWEDDSYLFEE